MTNPMTAGLRPPHPGELLRDVVLPALERPTAEIARLLKVSRQTLYDIMNSKKPVTPQMALRLGRMFGNAPEMWLKMQNAYDLRIEETRLADDLADIPHLQAA